MSKFDEQIIVVPRKVLFNDEKNAFNGFLHKNNIKGKDIFNALNEYEVKRRGDMEEDSTFKQLISYCLLEMKKVKSLYMSAYLAEEKKVAWSIFYRSRWSYERCYGSRLYQ